MPEFTLSPNSYGRVAGGQEGSGQAQILTPYDSSKFIKIKAADEAKKAEANAKTLKDFKLESNVVVKDPWEYDGIVYSKEKDALEAEYVNLEQEQQAFKSSSTNMSSADVAAKSLDLTSKYANLDRKKKQLNTKIEFGLQNKETWERDSNIYAGSEYGEYDPATTQRLEDFASLKGYEDIIEKTGSRDAARRYIYNEIYGGSLLVPVWDFDKYKTSQIAMNTSVAGTEIGSGYVYRDETSGLLKTVRTDNTTFDLKTATEGAKASVKTNIGWQNYLRENFADNLIEMGVSDPKNATKSELAQLIDTDNEVKQFVNDNFLPENIAKTTVTGSQLRQDAGGSKVLTPEEIQSESEASNIFGFTKGEEGWNDFVSKNKVLADWTGMTGTEGSGKMKESIFGAYQYTSGDVKNAVDATGKAGKNTQYEDPLTGNRRQIEGSYVITAPGFAGIKYVLLKDTVIDNKTYKKGDYINSSIVSGLKPNFDYRPISTTTTQGYGNANVEQADGKVKKEKVDIIIKNDAVEDFNLTPKAKQDAYQNEKTAVLVANENVVVVDSRTGNAYKASDVIKKYESAISGKDGSYEQWRKAVAQYESDLATGKLKFK